MIPQPRRMRLKWIAGEGLMLLCNRCSYVLSTYRDCVHRDTEHYCPGCSLKNEIETLKFLNNEWPDDANGDNYDRRT